MSVYIDPEIPCVPKGAYRWNRVTHLFADSIEELHDFAASIGMRREWFQMSRRGLPHYDLNTRRRMLAITKGAIELDAIEAFHERKHIRANHAEITIEKL